MNSKFTKILMLVLGIILIFMGVSKLVQFSFIPASNFNEGAENFMSSLNSTGYLLRFLGVMEIFIGGLLLANKWVPFALVLLAPITVNVLLFHLFLDSPGLILAFVVALLNITLIYKHWRVYKPLFH